MRKILFEAHSSSVWQIVLGGTQLTYQGGKDEIDAEKENWSYAV